MARSAWLALAAAALCGSSLPRRVQAEASPEPARAIVRTATPLDLEVARRIEGQSSDLDVRLEVLRAPEGSLAEHAAHAEALAARGAVVLWFARAGAHTSDPAGEPAPARTGTRAPRYLVYATVNAAAGPRSALLARLVMREPDTLASSALETAALVARAALQAFAHGEVIEAVTPARDEDPSAVRASAAAQPAASAHAHAPRGAEPPPAHEAEPAERSARAPDLELNLFAGAQQQLDGTGQLGRQGVQLRAGVRWQALELGLLIAPSFPNTTRDAFAALIIARHDLAASVALVTGSARFPIWLGAYSGAALLHRSTAARSERLSPRGPQLSAAWMIAPWLGAAYMGASFGVGVHVALDVLPTRPELRYAGEDASPLAYAPPWIAPRFALGLQARVP